MEEEKEKEGIKRKVMVVIDESGSSYQALMWVLNNLKESLKTSQLVLFATQQPPNCYKTWGAQLGFTRIYCPLLTTTILEMEENKKVSIGLLEKAKGICANSGIVHVETLTEAGDPKEVICNVIQRHKINMLVIGNHDNGIFKRLSKGNLSNYCIDYAKCHVLVVKS